MCEKKASMENVKKEQVLQEIEKIGTAVHTMLTKEYRMSEWENKLSSNQQLLLFLISKRKINSVKDLANELSVSPSAVSQMVAKLERMKLVKRSIDLDNRRNVILELEESGHELIEQLEQVRTEIFLKYFSKIEQDDLEQFRNLFKKFYDIMLQQSEEDQK